MAPSVRTPLVNTKKHMLSSVLLIKNSSVYHLSLNTEPPILNSCFYTRLWFWQFSFKWHKLCLNMLYFVTAIFANVNFKKVIIYGVNFSALLIKQKWLVLKSRNLTSSSLRSLASPISELLRATTLAAPDFIVIAFDLRFLSLNRFFLKYFKSMSSFFKTTYISSFDLDKFWKTNYLLICH